MDDDLRSALDRAAGGDPHVDLTETVWAQGRVVRRRRRVAQTVGGLAAAGVLAGAFALGGGLIEPQADVGPAVPTVDDGATGTLPPLSIERTAADPTPTGGLETAEAIVTVPDGADEAGSVAPPSTPAAPSPDAPSPDAPSPDAPSSDAPTARTPTPPATEPSGEDPSGSEPPATPPGEDPEPSTTPTTDPPVAAPLDPCSTPYPDPVLLVDGLPEAARIKGAGVLGQAAACNLDGLIAMARQDQTFLSFGLTPPEQAFAGAEGAERASAITILMTSFAPAQRGPDGPYQWPGSITTEEDWQRLVTTGLYTQEEVDLMRSVQPGYAGWRVGVTADGTWTFMVAGD